MLVITIMISLQNLAIIKKVRNCLEIAIKINVTVQSQSLA